MKKNAYNIAILGATGAVGRCMLDILADSDFPVGHLYLLASARSAGEFLDFKGESIEVLNANDFDFKQADLALFSAGATTSATYAPRAASAGCVVIDNSSQFRYQDDIPLVVPEVNATAIADYTQRHIIANPNCSTIQMVVALKPIYDAVGIERINIATYQAVSGAGQRGVAELLKQSTHVLNAKIAQSEVFPTQIAFNAIPHIDVFQENGYTKEEMKMVWETQKIFADPTIRVNPTAVRIPVFYGHSEAIHIETKEKISAQDARVLLEKADGVTVIDDPNDANYPTAVGQGGCDGVFVGRIREDISHPKGLNLWVVADNVRKGAALNAVQIAKCLISDYI